MADRSGLKALTGPPIVEAGGPFLSTDEKFDEVALLWYDVSDFESSISSFLLLACILAPRCFYWDPKSASYLFVEFPAIEVIFV